MKHWQQKRFYLWSSAILIIFSIAFLCFHSAVIQPTGDDIWFRDMTANINLIDYLEMRYLSWTGRLPIELLLTGMLRLPLLYWHLLGAFSITLMGWALSRVLIYIFDNQMKTDAIFMFIIAATVPLIVWIFSDVITKTPVYVANYQTSATSVALYWYSGYFNYFLPFSLCFTMIALFLEMRKKKRYSGLFTAGIILLSIYTTASEQAMLLWAYFCFCMLSVDIYTWFLQEKMSIKQILQKKSVKLESFIYLLTGVFSLFYITAPGNQVRVAKEIQTWMPEFSYLSIIEKLQLGLGYGFEMLIRHMLGLFFVLFFLSMVIFWKRKKKHFVLLSLLGQSVTSLLFFCYLFIYFRDKEWQLLKVSFDSKTDFHWSFLGSLFIVFLLILLFLVAWHIFANQKQKLFLMLCLSFGLVNSALMGFSPTVYGSGIRTQYISFLCYGFVFMIVLLEAFYLFKKRNKKIK